MGTGVVCSWGHPIRDGVLEILSLVQLAAEVKVRKTSDKCQDIHTRTLQACKASRVRSGQLP